MSSRNGGAKGAWRYMFSGGQLSGTCMHYDEYAQVPFPSRTPDMSVISLKPPLHPSETPSIDKMEVQQNDSLVRGRPSGTPKQRSSLRACVR